MPDWVEIQRRAQHNIVTPFEEILRKIDSLSYLLLAG
jgi:hypothetical protein